MRRQPNVQPSNRKVTDDDRDGADTAPFNDSADAADNLSDDDEFLDDFVSGLGEDAVRIVGSLERVKDVYVACGRDNLLKAKFDKFLHLVASRRDGRRDDGRCFFLTGESGAGKTALARHLLAQYPNLQPRVQPWGKTCPVVSVTLKGPVIMKTLGHNILRGTGYPLVQDLEENKVWDMLPEQLHLRKVMLVHIDEPQHLLTETPTGKERKKVAKAFKGVMNDPTWPVSFLLTGMPNTTELARLDEQIERRGFQFPLVDVALPEERRLVVRILTEMASAVDIDVAGIVASDIPERVAHAAAYRYARIAQVVLAGIHEALVGEAAELTREHFATAFIEHSHARGNDDMNPFLAHDWVRLPPGAFIVKPD
ncbi:ATP-binding protein [Fulvimarina endophytica]|uniref:ATP-binding protein n=1 Tax=Fulvimarina endophytica TaxID=2293836 RepID=A0A371X0H4_9HYPH|nr:ATP-binding protein [Fulvimarina endophytica]RFC62743.1 ATP-binding protein [Fulvimarina endophytica]